MSAAIDPFAPENLREIAPPDPADPFFGHTAHVHERADPRALAVLGLDLGASMGFAHRTSACVTSGVKEWKVGRFEHQGHRLARMTRWLADIHAATPLSLIAYEVVQFMGERQVAAAHAWAQYEGVVLTFAARKAIPVKSVAVATLKKAITGRGAKFPREEGETGSDAGKRAMMNAIKAQGFAPASHDEADAIGVLLWAVK